MAWTCKSCGSLNPTNAARCSCGDRTPIPFRINAGWIAGGSVVFLVVYLFATFMGGLILATYVEPDDARIAKTLAASGGNADSVASASPADREAARQKAIGETAAATPLPIRLLLFWLIPVLALPATGMLVAYISEGRTIIEPAAASMVGQVLGFLMMRLGGGADLPWLALVIGLVLGPVVTGIGAYYGEAIQERRERAAMATEIPL